MRKCRFDAHIVSLALIAVLTAVFSPQRVAAECPAGGVEVGRETTGGETIVYCKRIKELNADEIRSLPPGTVRSLSVGDRELLRERRRELGIVIVVSPSLIVSPEERDFLRTRLAELKGKRARMDKELEAVRRSRETIDQAAMYNAHVLHDLTGDSISHALNILEGGLSLYGGTVPPATMEKIKAALAVSKATTNGIAAATSEADSQRQILKLAEAVLALKNLVPSQGIGIDAAEWKAIRQAFDTFPKLVEISQRIADTPYDKSLWRDWTAYLDDMVAIGGKFSVRVKSAHSAGQLLAIQWALRGLKDDRNDLREAGVASQTAQRYWVTRIGKAMELEKFYETRLAGGAAVEDELEGL